MASSWIIYSKTKVKKNIIQRNGKAQQKFEKWKKKNLGVKEDGCKVIVFIVLTAIELEEKKWQWLGKF